MAYTPEEQREKKRVYMRQYRLDNLELLNAKNKKWRTDNPEKARANTKRWLSKNVARNKACKAAYAIKHADKLRAASRELAARRRETDDNFRIKENLYSRLNGALRRARAKKVVRTMALFGCDIHFLRGYLEARFLPGMTWDNHGNGNGQWQIDHRIPCAEFDLRDPAQQAQCFRYTNLQPMWGLDNRRKGAKRTPTHQAELI